jgi:uncharacterized membrane protein
MAALAAVAGLTDVIGDRRVRELNDVWWHAGVNVIAVLIELINWYIRYRRGEAAILPWGVILSFVVVGILCSPAGKAGKWCIGTVWASRMK